MGLTLQDIIIKLKRGRELSLKLLFPGMNARVIIATQAKGWADFEMKDGISLWYLNSNEILITKSGNGKTFCPTSGNNGVGGTMLGPCERFTWQFTF